MANSKQLVYFFKEEINNARRRPTSIIPHLQNRVFVNQFQFKHWQLNNIHYKTLQGKHAADQTINYLIAKQPVQQLILSAQLCEAAYQVGNQIIHAHPSSTSQIFNPQSFIHRVDEELLRLGVLNIGQTEMIVQYGFRFDREVVPTILVSDGDHTRHNRYLLMSDQSCYLGISIHQHSQYDYMVVILLNNQNFRPKKWGCNCTIF